jgi:hypothetical protein
VTGPSASRSLRKLGPEDPPYVHTENLIVMECCDLGCVWSGVEKGFFHYRSKDGQVTVHLNRLLHVSKGFGVIIGRVWSNTIPRVLGLGRGVQCAGRAPCVELRTPRIAGNQTGRPIC